MSQTDFTTALALALKFKYLMSAFYAKGLATTYPTAFRSDEQQILTQIAKHEAAHVTALHAALGGAAPAAPGVSSYDFTGGGGNGCGPFRAAFGAPQGTSPTGSAVAATPPDQLEFLKLAMLLEDLGVRAFAGELATLMGTPHLATLVRIRSTDARHSATIRRIRNSYQGGTEYSDPMRVDYRWVAPWISSLSLTGGVGFADPGYTAEVVYPGGLSQLDIINGKATSSVVNGTTVLTTVTTGVYGPLVRNVYSKPITSSPNEDNCYQSSSQAANVLVPNRRASGWYDVDAAFDEPLSPSSAVALVALFGVT